MFYSPKVGFAIPKFEDVLPIIRCLPAGRPLTQAELLRPEFCIYRHGAVESYYMPFGSPVSDARLLVAGITPGWQQMELAYREIRRGLGAGLDLTAVRANARYVASFAGPMRTNLVAMLDGIGIASALHIDSTAELFAGERNQLHTTSVLPHPVFVNGKNYTGHGGGVATSPFSNFCMRELFVGEVQSVPRALIVPLGDFVSNTLRELITNGIVDEHRCLLGFPHPSGANGHRAKRYQERKADLTTQVKAWCWH